MADIAYTAPPTCGRFMASESFGRIIAGPVGSGKTVSCIVELLRRAIQQSEAPDGYRYTRFAVVRQTLKQLKDTVLKDCKQWLGGVGEWKVSDNTFYLNFDNVRSEWIFIPLEDSADQARLLSMQLTGAWLSEVIEMDISILGPISGRMPRFPSAKLGNPTWFGMIADTNFPTELTPWHTFMENPPPNWAIFKQPSGLADNAENLNHLGQTDVTSKLPINHPVRLAQGRTYYERYVQMYGIESDWVKRYVLAQYGDDPSGLAVFRASFNSKRHVVDDTILIPGYPILVAQDFGRDPWSLICQCDHMGRLIVHEEVAATNIGLEKHINEHLRPRLLSDKYMGNKVVVVGDPAGVSKSTHSEETSFDLLSRLGLPCFPAVTNDIDPRLRAVEALLNGSRGMTAAMLINGPMCPKLLRALAGGYRFTKMKSGMTKPVPDKNEYSHVADALQYASLVAHAGLVDEIAKRLAPRSRKPKNAMPAGAWS